MAKSDSTLLFNSIAPVYGLFYEMQKKRYSAVIDVANKALDITKFKTILDVGCGTGALCSVLHRRGLQVTGVDPAEKMLRIARKKPETRDVTFTLADAAKELPFADKVFDVTIASYVAHGMGQADRKRLYAQMSRVTKSKVIIYDYNTERSLLTTVIEWMERGDYFNFIRNAEVEMEECVLESGEKCFSDVKMVPVGTRAAWYICIPTDSMPQEA